MVRFDYSVDVGKSLETEEEQKSGEKLSAEKLEKELQEQQDEPQEPKKEAKPSENPKLIIKPIKDTPTPITHSEPEKEEPKEKTPEKPEKTEEQPIEPEKKEEQSQKQEPEEKPSEEKKEDLKVKSISFEKAELLKDVQQPLDEGEADVTEMVDESFEKNNKEFAAFIKPKKPRWGVLVCVALILAAAVFFFMKPAGVPTEPHMPEPLGLAAVPIVAPVNITEEPVVEFSEPQNASVDDSLAGLAFALKD